MNTISRAGWVSVLLLCTAGWLSAQKTSLNEDLVRADRQFALYAYNLAMQTYQQVLKDDPRNAHALARVGDCYYQLNTPEKSLEWYLKAIRQYNTEADVHLRYGMALMQTKAYDAAKDQFMEYAQSNEAVGNHYVSVCDYATQNSLKESAWQVKNEPLNTEYADFCPTFLGSRIVYSSARTDIVAKGKSSDSPSGSQNYLLVTQVNPESALLQKPQILRSELQNARNEGPSSFSADGRRVAFCRNNFINGTRQIAESGINMSLYTAEVDDNGKWINIKAFPYNGSSFATGFPALSPDGGTLIFSSTQPGGFGGWDIYVSNWKDNNWTTPRNLGSPLNSPGNEVTPFYDGASLYFSSDWHQGFGGLDVFRAELGREEVSNIFHLGPGVNSERDDYGFIFNSNDNVGYVTSTRPGGRGNEDIWKLTKKWNEEATAAAVQAKTDTPFRPSEYNDVSGNNNSITSKTPVGMHLLITDERGNGIPGAEVDLTDCYGEKGFTDRDGRFSFTELNRTISCRVTIRKTGFQDTEITLNQFGQQNVRIGLTPESRERFSGRVYDASSRAAVRGVTVEIKFQDGSKSVEAQTDADGYYELFLDPGTTYLVNYSKYGYVGQIAKTYLGTSMGKISNIYLEQEAIANTSTNTQKIEYADYSNTPRPSEYSTDNNSSIKTIYKQPAVEQAPVVVPPVFNGYSIQLAAMPDEPSNYKLGTYESLTKDGNLYVKKEGNLHKIRLGIFKTKAEVDAVLKKVVATKIQKDAFIVDEYGADESLMVGYQAPIKPVEHSNVPATSLASKGLNPAIMYALQLGSFSAEKAIAIGDYANLRGMGNLYSNQENGYTQVRLGIWDSYPEAEKAQKEAVNRGFPKSVIVTEKGNDPDIQDFVLSKPAAADINKTQLLNPAVRPQEYSTTAQTLTKPFFIRIAALSNPDRFDGSSLADLGYIEKRQAENSPGMTVILLASYPNQAAAQKALEQVQRRGYAEAYILEDVNGRLFRR